MECNLSKHSLELRVSLTTLLSSRPFMVKRLFPIIQNVVWALPTTYDVKTETIEKWNTNGTLDVFIYDTHLFQWKSLSLTF
jgi:hypothetical protein